MIAFTKFGQHRLLSRQAERYAPEMGPTPSDIGPKSKVRDDRHSATSDGRPQFSATRAINEANVPMRI